MGRSSSIKVKTRKEEENEAIKILVVLVAILVCTGIIITVVKGNHEAAQMGKFGTSIVAPQYGDSSSSWRGDSAFWSRTRRRIQREEDASKVKDK